jgi:hypothetical protein
LLSESNFDKKFTAMSVQKKMNELTPSTAENICKDEDTHKVISGAAAPIIEDTGRALNEIDHEPSGPFKVTFTNPDNKTTTRPFNRTGE